VAEELGLPAYRGRQIFTALHRRRLASFEAMTDLPRALREQLAGSYAADRPAIDTVQRSADGTRKYRFRADDGVTFEAVYIPEVAAGRKTNTLCLSSQTGCAVGCTFCFSATIRRSRDLTAAEIVGQVHAVADDVATRGTAARVRNIVFMGMGEPLLNYEQVVRACRVLLDGEGADYSSRRITVSTAGIVPRIRDLGRDVQTQLAVSLNATTDQARDRIMPINRKWPLGELVEAMRGYPLQRRRRITIEYVLLAGVNDSLEDARRLPRLLAGIPIKVNLLQLNAHERTDLAPSDPAQVLRFQEVLHRAGVNAIIRTPRGRDISAACGQLGGANLPAAAPATPRP
jgi:23S rRNA (adenine2503-C2)-methyltransferase